MDDYRSIVISGGEPTLLLTDDLVTVLSDVRRRSMGAPCYLQTNGKKLTKHLVKTLDDYIDGIGLSIHDMDEFLHMRTRWLDILKIKPIRLYMEMEKHDRIGYPEIIFDGFKLRLWEKGEFAEDEDIFVLSEK